MLIRARRIIATISKLDFSVPPLDFLPVIFVTIIVLVAIEETAASLEAVLVLHSNSNCARLSAAVKVLFFCALFSIFFVPSIVLPSTVAVFGTHVQIAAKLGAKTVLHSEGLERVLVAARLLVGI